MARKLVSYRLAEDLQTALKERASGEGISVTELVNRLLRQGLGLEPGDAGWPGRVSHLERVVHQLEQRLAGQSLAPGEGSGAIAAAAVARRLLALEQKIDALTRGVEEKVPQATPWLRPVAPSQGEPGAAEPDSGWGARPQLSTLDPGREMPQDVVQMPLSALRKLLGAPASD